MPAEKYQEFSPAKSRIPVDSAMSWTIEYVKARHFVRIIVTGVYNTADHIRMIEDVVNRDFWQPGTNVLIDDSGLDFSRTNLEELREAGMKRIEMNALIGNGKTAVLVSSITDFARVRQFELITSGKISARIDIFKDEEKALRWLLD